MVAKCILHIDGSEQYNVQALTTVLLSPIDMFNTLYRCIHSVQYNSSKTVGGILETKLQKFCTQMDNRTQTNRLMDRQKG